ncbi:hypothetical protein [Hathewaya limosa]|uniref:Uncharacterized protein n=1 Tax=Hathewaya limosa TaxID=1536 RepID=A0ABU0JT35_HATLI|nr:hypothetical protein [Hathewaya limosa]MDQ0480260.1 hypothetical protein [Hathewaya limosa]
MPIPFLLAGLGIAAGVLGAGGHLSAKETNEKAQRVSQDAQDLYNNAKYSLEQAQNKTEKALLKLGYAKKNTLDTSMTQFLNSYDKVKHIQVTESIGINEISNFTIDQQDAIELKKMTDIYSSAIKSGATGTAAGAVVALAASGSLTVVTGGLTTAGSALLAGEVSAAAGIAGSALSFGAAMTPLAAVAAPVILFTGISASMKADENLEKANTMYAQAEVASEKMKVSETLCGAITDRSEMFNSLLADLNGMFSECSGLLAGVIKKKQGTIFKKKLTSEDFTEEDLKLIAVTRALAGAVKSVIDTPILSKDGNVAYKSEEVYDQTIEKLPDFSQAVEEVKQIDYDVKPVETKVRKNNTAPKAKGTVGTNVASGVRRVFAIVLGFFLATAFAKDIALHITLGADKFLFLDSFIANKIAVWIFIFTSVAFLIGKFQKSKFRKWWEYGSALGIFVFYVQYCRTVEMMNHYIIFCIIVFVVSSVIYGFVEGKKDTWSTAYFILYLSFCVMAFQFLFLIYAFFSKFIGFSEGFCLVVTSIFMLLVSLGFMNGSLDN